MGTVDLAKIAALAENLNQDSGGQSGSGDFLGKFVQLENGTNTVRILPPASDGLDFYAQTSIHRVMNADGKVQNFHCLGVETPGHDKQECPLCKLYYSLWDAHNALKLPKGEKSEFANLATQIKARPRYYLNVFDRRAEGVKILSIGQILFKKIINTMVDPDFGDITDLSDGHDFKIVKVMEGEWPKYDQSQARPKPSPLAGSDAEVAEIMSSLHDIHGLVQFPEYDDVRNIALELAAGAGVTVKGIAPVASAPSDGSDDDAGDDDNYLARLKGEDNEND